MDERVRQLYVCFLNSRFTMKGNRRIEMCAIGAVRGIIRDNPNKAKPSFTELDEDAIINTAISNGW
jgi:hypothetical protein